MTATKDFTTVHIIIGKLKFKMTHEQNDMTRKTQNCIIIGASHAASQACASLRQGGWEGSITVIGDETPLPYHRPPLSKDFLSGNRDLDEILIRPSSTYENMDVSMVLETRVTAIDRTMKTVLTDKGETFTYDKLILTTGARIRELPIPGTDLGNIFYLRDTADVLAIKSNIKAGKKAVIIGGGYIGLETAASLRKQGMEVTVLEAMSRILQRVTAPEMSDFFRQVHGQEGVKIHETTIASEIQKIDTGLTVLTSEGQSFDADFVIIGIGVIPNTELAAECGLKVSNGIDVNKYCQTSDPDIYAAGDVTWHYNPIYDQHIRLESVPNANEQAKVVANHINGTPKPYKSLPWFWSDQYDVKLQICGLSTNYDQTIVRGDPAARKFAVFYFRDNQLIACDAVNSAPEFLASKMIIIKGHKLDPHIFEDTNLSMKEIAGLSK